MTRAFVADASIAIAWVHPAQATAQTAAMLDAIAGGATLEVPALWSLEVANALIVLQRRRKLTEDERQAALGWLRRLPICFDPRRRSWRSRAYRSSPPHTPSPPTMRRTLKLAQRRRLLLGCKDSPLRKAAGRAGVRLWE